MNIKLDSDISPERLYLHNQSKRTLDKENRELKYRESMKVLERSYSGKKTNREPVEKSIKKILDQKTICTERIFR